MIDTSEMSLRVYQRLTQGFIVDVKTYYTDAPSKEEAHFLCGLLNAPCVSEAIKAYQTRGIYVGERDIHRTPFEACAIPPFDPQDAIHAELAALSQRAHENVGIMQHSKPKGGVVALRKMARTLADKQLRAIDMLAREVLGL